MFEPIWFVLKVICIFYYTRVRSQCGFCILGRYALDEAFTRETWCIHMWDMTNPSVRHDSSTRDTWPIHMWNMTQSHVTRDSSICESWRMRTWDMTRLYVGHDSFISETWLAYMWHMTHPSAKHDALTCDSRLLHMWVMTHSPARHDSFTFWTRLIHMCDMPHSYWRVHKCVSLPSMSAFWRSHVSRTNKLYLLNTHTYMSYTWKFRGTRVCPRCRHFEGVKCHTRMSNIYWYTYKHITYLSVQRYARLSLTSAFWSCVTYKWVIYTYTLSYILHTWACRGARVCPRCRRAVPL